MRLTVATGGGQAPPGGRPYSAGSRMSFARRRYLLEGYRITDGNDRDSATMVRDL